MSAAKDHLDEVSVGRVSKLFGKDGELEVTLFDTFPEDFNIKEEAVFVNFDGIPTPLFFSKLILRGRTKAQVQFDDFDTDSRAMSLIGKTFFMLVAGDELSDTDGDLYLEDLVGYDFISATTDDRGKIVDFIDSDLNPLFVILVNGREFLVPAHDDMINNISTKKHTVTLIVADGIFDLLDDVPQS